MLKKYTILIGICCSILLSFSNLHSQTSNQPNILIIIADDLGTDAINGYQNSPVLPVTPNIDNLRASGIAFDEAWATPKCSPTRAAIMSGKYPHKNGVVQAPGNLDTSHESIFKALENQTNGAYSDAVFGKWHISHPVDDNHPAQHGIDHFVGKMQSGGPYDSWSKTVNGQTTTSNEYCTEVFTDEAISWVNNQNNPWLMWFAHTAPHSPFHVPPSGTYSINNPTTNLEKYIAMIENMDYEIGRLLSNIPQDELDNTVIFFLGDNGTPKKTVQNYPTNHNKSSLYEGGVRVPMFVSGAGVTRVNEREDALVNVLDVYATVLDLAGANLPGGVHNSKSFVHLLDNSAGENRIYNFTELHDSSTDGYAIRNNQYKLIEYANGTQEFYDLSASVLENTNLLNVGLSPEEAAAKADLELEASAIINGWSCRDGIQNGVETGIDCGGSCANSCSTSSCSDGIQNGDETGVDCGGSCPTACATCFDGIQNGDETGIDCGGSCAASCNTGNCSDGIQNGDETGVDCGGSCPTACATCFDGIQNGDETGVDCGGSCAAACATCFDGIQNGDETGVDCGGSCANACGGCTTVGIDYSNFESGWGIWNNGGSDCRRNANDAAYANGNYCIRLRDNTSTSVTTSDVLDLSSFEEITVEFSYYARSMDNVNEDFWLQISNDGGSSFVTVEDWRQGIDFQNNSREYESVLISGPFSSNAQLRFRCDASGNSDWVYIDDVDISGCTTGSNIVTRNATPESSNEAVIIEEAITQINLYPNPVQSELNVEVKGMAGETAEVVIMDLTGRVHLKEKTLIDEVANLNYDVSNLNRGIYIISVFSKNGVTSKKFVKR